VEEALCALDPVVGVRYQLAFSLGEVRIERLSVLAESPGATQPADDARGDFVVAGRGAGSVQLAQESRFAWPS
jgi:hypothetical protein